MSKSRSSVPEVPSARAIDDRDIVDRSLTSFSVRSSIEIIGEWCFMECSFLSEVIFHPVSHLKLIEEHVFSSCISIRFICIPASVEILGEQCFSGC
jgi:hypothetical protein